MTSDLLCENVGLQQIWVYLIVTQNVNVSVGLTIFKRILILHFSTVKIAISVYDVMHSLFFIISFQGKGYCPVKFYFLGQ